MVRRLPKLSALRAFEAAARRGSFSLAAEELGITQGAVSHQIKALETYLGVQLFRRLTRAIRLTDQGKNYIATISRAFDGIEQATLQLRAASERKILTVNVLPTFAIQVLIPRLFRFNKANPDIEVRMITSIEPVNFGRDDVDLAIRVGTPPITKNNHAGPRIDLDMTAEWTELSADLLAPDVIVPVCSSKFLQKHGPFRRAADFVGKPLIHNASRPRAWPDWFAAFDLSDDRASEGAAFGHFFMAMQAASTGQGLALVPTILVHHDLRRSDLVVLDQFMVESAGAYYLLCRNYQRDDDHIRKFCEWLTEECGTIFVREGSMEAASSPSVSALPVSDFSPGSRER